MKNKFLILISLLMALCTISSALAFTMPHPVYGKITADGYSAVNADIRVKNLNTRTDSVTTTDSSGFYQLELANVDPTYREGDTLQISLIYCERVTKCVRTVKIAGGGTQLDFDIEQEALPEVPSTIKIVKYVCWDGSVSESQSACPKQPEPVVVPPVVVPQTKYVCEDGTTVSNKDDCKEPLSPIEVSLSILGGLLAIALGILAKFKWGKGFVGLANYYVKKGDEAKAKKDFATAEIYYKRAAKMVSSALKKASDGTYK